MRVITADMVSAPPTSIARVPQPESPGRIPDGTVARSKRHASHNREPCANILDLAFDRIELRLPWREAGSSLRGGRS